MVSAQVAGIARQVAAPAESRTVCSDFATTPSDSVVCTVAVFAATKWAAGSFAAMMIG